MLAKQLWRILMNPDSLISQLLQCKYFPGTDIFTAKILANASYAWRSLMEARDLIVAGSQWRLRRLEEQGHCDQSDGSCGRWLDVELVRALFPPHETECILAVPVHGIHEKDRLIWHYDLQGRFTVRSAYRLALSIEEAQNSRQGQGNTFVSSPSWNFLWKAKTNLGSRTASLVDGFSVSGRGGRLATPYEARTG
ncbi:UNVERIFIED_CONTAM: putative mitochondrial protein [Sesamum latifolium]|uniref:Mitochondrial protein n=1 Tax=Sesamum latifolium TaxID=2727402 RepID=A0AAW2WCJ7_9LAMI